ncbi:MAG: hypothetical protein ACK526_11815 [Planctomyces sp.]
MFRASLMDQILSLNGDMADFSDADGTLMNTDRHPASPPIAVTDQGAADALKHHRPEHLDQLINLMASFAYFCRAAEAAGLPADPAFPR